MNEIMTLQDAIKIIEDYQKWRTSESPYDSIGVQLKHTPKQISQALDMILEEVKRVAMH